LRAELTFLVFETAALSDADGCAGLVGDVNAFLMSRAHGAGYAATGAGRAAPDETAAGGCDGDGVTAEVMVMIAEPAARRRGFAVEAVAALLRYCKRARTRGARYALPPCAAPAHLASHRRRRRRRRRAGMEHLGVRTAVAKISASNAPSLALFQQRLGFVESRRLPCFEEVHLAAGAAQGLRERVDALTARSGYAEARCEPAEGDDVPPPAR